MKLRDLWRDANPAARVCGVVIVTGIALATAYGLMGHDVVDMFKLIPGMILRSVKSWL